MKDVKNWIIVLLLVYGIVASYMIGEGLTPTDVPTPTTTTPTAIPTVSSSPATLSDECKKVEGISNLFPEYDEILHDEIKSLLLDQFSGGFGSNVTWDEMLFYVESLCGTDYGLSKY